MQDRPTWCQERIFPWATLVCLLGACKGGPSASSAQDGAIGAECVAVLDAVSRVPNFAGAGSAHFEAVNRGEAADVLRLAASTGPFGWLALPADEKKDLRGAVGARCADGEAMLAFACMIHGDISARDTDVFVRWAYLHPAVRADDGPAMAPTIRRLERLGGSEAARDALARAVYPAR